MEEKVHGLNDWKAEVNVGPIWDGHLELDRLRGIVTMLATLTSRTHLQEDNDAEVFYHIFIDLSERLDKVCEDIGGCLNTMKIISYPSKDKKASATVSAAAEA